MTSNTTSLWKILILKLRDLEKNNNTYLIYISLIYLFSLPLIFVLIYMDPCLFYLILPGFALLIPYMIFEEKDFKVLGVVGVIALILLGFTFTAYQVESIYMDREPDELSSESLKNGLINKVQGDVGENFEFTVLISHEAYEEVIRDDNYTLKVQLSRYIEEDEEVIDDYKMDYLEDVNDEGRLYKIEISDLEEALYQHRFLLTVEREDEDYQEETEYGFGPFTVSRSDLYLTILTQQISTSLIIFVVFLGFLWWKKGMEQKAKQRAKKKKAESEGKNNLN